MTERPRFQLPERRWDQIAVVAVVFGAVLRFTWTFAIHPPVAFVYSDMRGYVTRAERLASGGPLGPADAFYPPGTQALLALPLKLYGAAGSGLWAAAVLWCVLSIATVWMSWRLTRELLTPAAAAVTAVLCALSPLFITFGGFFTSETPAMTFLVAALWLGIRASRQGGRASVALALAAGALGGVAIAVRPQLVLNIAILAVIILITFRRRVLPLASFAAGVLAVLALVVAHNSAAADQPTGLSTNGGLNFWFGHCDARQVVTFNAAGQQTATFTHAVPNLAGRGQNYVFRGVDIWDDAFFYDLGRLCIEQDGPAHVLRLARNVVDMTATALPFPQAEGDGWQREVVRAANGAYSVLLPWIVIESMFLIARRRRTGESLPTAFLLGNLACAVLVAVVFLGDPRVRSVYDVFGLALLAALLTDRFHLDANPADVDGGAEPAPP